MDLTARAHQMIMEGYKLYFGNKLITTFSAPNYCYRYNKASAILQLDGNLRTNFFTFNTAPENTRPIPEKRPLPD